jgi:hypothetical protein
LDIWALIELVSLSALSALVMFLFLDRFTYVEIWCDYEEPTYPLCIEECDPDADLYI